MPISRFAARLLTFALLLLLFLGTLMPGAWKDAATRPFHSGIDLPALAHVALFAAIFSMVPLARFWTVKFWHAPALGLALALLTEGLQFFAIDRHPNLAGVGQDLLGALIGGAVGWRLAASGRTGEAVARRGR
jgi:hypothetical protein